MSLEDNCPDFEKLSARFDNESKNDSDIKQTESTDGQATLDDIKKIDDALSTVLSSVQPGTGFKEKLLNASNKPAKSELRIVSHLLKLAAILAAAFILDYLADSKDNVQSSNNLVENRAVPEKSTVPVMVADTSNEMKLKPIEDSIETSISEKDFQLVSMNKQTTIEKTVEIKDTVKHVWLTEDVGEALKLIDQQITSLNILEKRVDAAGSYHLSVQLQEQQLIQKVDWFAKQGFSLVSPDFPQPGTNTISKTPERLVTYKITVIKKQ